MSIYIGSSLLHSLFAQIVPYCNVYLHCLFLIAVSIRSDSSLLNCLFVQIVPYSNVYLHWQFLIAVSICSDSSLLWCLFTLAAPYCSVYLLTGFLIKLTFILIKNWNESLWKKLISQLCTTSTVVEHLAHFHGFESRLCTQERERGKIARKYKTVYVCNIKLKSLQKLSEILTKKLRLKMWNFVTVKLLLQITTLIMIYLFTFTKYFKQW